MRDVESVNRVGGRLGRRLAEEQRRLLGLAERAAAGCSDGDTGCLEHDCSMWCSKWTCGDEGCTGCGASVGCPDLSPPPPSPPPLPALPPWDTDIDPGTLNIIAHNGHLYANGEKLHIKGVNWFGSEGRAGPPLGLDSAWPGR